MPHFSSIRRCDFGGILHAIATHLFFILHLETKTKTPAGAVFCFLFFFANSESSLDENLTSKVEQTVNLQSSKGCENPFNQQSEVMRNY